MFSSAASGASLPRLARVLERLLPSIATMGNFHPKIQLTVTTTYDSDMTSVTFSNITVRNLMQGAPGALRALTQVNVTSTILLPGASTQCTESLTGSSPFRITFRAEGLDSDDNLVWVEITAEVAF